MNFSYYYYRTLEEKNRLQLPSVYLREGDLEKGKLVTLINTYTYFSTPCAELYPCPIGQLNSYFPKEYYLSLATEVQIDKNHRIHLDEEMLNHIVKNEGESILLTGRGEYIAIMSATKGNSELEKIKREFSELYRKSR